MSMWRAYGGLRPPWYWAWWCGVSECHGGGRTSYPHLPGYGQGRRLHGIHPVAGVCRRLCVGPAGAGDPARALDAPARTGRRTAEPGRRGDVEGAFDAAQGDASLLGQLALAVLSNAQNGKEAMESAMNDTGAVESNKLMNKNRHAEPHRRHRAMLGLTGTTVGMIETFTVMSSGGRRNHADKMARGISIALICTFTGLMVAIPCWSSPISSKPASRRWSSRSITDCNEMIRVILAVANRRRRKGKTNSSPQRTLRTQRRNRFLVCSFWFSSAYSVVNKCC